MTTERIVRRLPEVALIGILLLLFGVVDTDHSATRIQQIVTLWPQLNSGVFGAIGVNYTGQPRGLLLFMETLSIVLAVAAIVSGIGLLRGAPWARRVTVFTLIGLLAVDLIGSITGMVFSILPAFQYGMNPFVVKTILSSLLHLLLGILYNTVLLLFITSPRVRDAFGESDEWLGGLHRLSRRVPAWLPTGLAPVVALIALLLVVSTLPYLIGSLVSGVSLHNLFPISSGLPSLSITTLTDYSVSLTTVYMVASLLAGICLLTRVPGSAIFAVIILVVGAILPIFSLITVLVITEQPFNRMASALFVPTIIAVLTALLQPAVMAWFLMRYRHGEMQQPPEVEVAV